MTTMAQLAERPLETGWLPDTPVEDTLLRRFVHHQADVNAVMAGALGGRVDRTDDVFLADAASPVPYFNQAILARPLTGSDDPALDVIDAFFGTGAHPATVLSVWPTPDLSSRGWSPIGHPALVVRAPGPSGYEPPEDVEVRVATSPETFAAAERVAVDGYPLDGAPDLPVGSVFPPALADTGLVVRLGLLSGEPVGIGNRFTGHGLVNVLRRDSACRPTTWGVGSTGVGESRRRARPARHRVHERLLPPRVHPHGVPAHHTIHPLGATREPAPRARRLRTGFRTLT
jgi:hypothetical protein